METGRKIMEKNPSKDSKKQNKLSILVARDGLYFCVSSPKKQVISFYKEEFTSSQSPEILLKKIQEYFTHSSHLRLASTIDELKVFYAHSLFSLVPRSYFEEEKLSDYLKYNIHLLPTDELSFDKLKKIEANLAYIPFTNINNYLFEKFGEFTYKHVVSVFIDQCIKLADPEKTEMFIQVFPTHLSLCVFDEGELQIANNFDYYSPEDFIYYVLFVIENLKIDRENMNLWLGGAIEENSKIFDLLYAYIKEVKFLSGSEEVTIKTPVLKEAELHTFQFIIDTI